MADIFICLSFYLHYKHKLDFHILRIQQYNRYDMDTLNILGLFLIITAILNCNLQSVQAMDSLLQSERHSGPSHVEEHSIYSSWHFDEHISSKGRSLKCET